MTVLRDGIVKPPPNSHNESRRPAPPFVYENLVTRFITYQQRKARADVAVMIQHKLQQFFGKAENAEERFGKSGSQCAINEELSYQKPLSMTYAGLETISRPVKQSEPPVLREQPVITAPSPRAIAQSPGVDINLLTDQVYQALERRIRLEKQRRGYR